MNIKLSDFDEEYILKNIDSFYQPVNEFLNQNHKSLNKNKLSE